jgi:hypothetical protein
VFNLTRIVLTIISSLVVRTSFLANDISTIIDVTIMQTLALIVLAIIELIVEMNKEIEEDDN